MLQFCAHPSELLQKLWGEIFVRKALKTTDMYKTVFNEVPYRIYFLKKSHHPVLLGDD